MHIKATIQRYRRILAAASTWVGIKQIIGDTKKQYPPELVRACKRVKSIAPNALVKMQKNGVQLAIPKTNEDPDGEEAAAAFMMNKGKLVYEGVAASDEKINGTTFVVHMMISQY